MIWLVMENNIDLTNDTSSRSDSSEDQSCTPGVIARLFGTHAKCAHTVCVCKHNCVWCLVVFGSPDSRIDMGDEHVGEAESRSHVRTFHHHGHGARQGGR